MSIQQKNFSEASCPVCIVTGLSGAGKSTALAVFEDLRYFTVDGLPATLAPEMVAMMARPSMAHFKGIALGMDIRQGNFLDEIQDVMSQVKKLGLSCTLLFFEADAQILLRRYATTRRPHPLEKEGMGLEAALQTEKERLAPLRAMAQYIIDTSSFSIHDLRRALQKRWQGNKGKTRNIRINVISFGFKYGVPREADMVFDLRFLPNPYFEERLRPLSGQDPSVADYVFAKPASRNFVKKLQELLFMILPLMEAEGRYRTTIAVGCTGGRHRSVALAEALHLALKQADYPVTVEHRHLDLG